MWLTWIRREEKESKQLTADKSQTLTGSPISDGQLCYFHGTLTMQQLGISVDFKLLVKHAIFSYSDIMKEQYGGFQPTKLKVNRPSIF